MMHFYKTLCLLFMCLFMHGNASSQHTNWKKYQKLEGDIDSLYIKTYEVRLDDDKDLTIATDAKPKRTSTVILSDQQQIVSLDNRFYSYENDILKSIYDGYRRYKVVHNEFEDRYIIFRPNADAEEEIYEEYHYDGPHLSKIYSYKNDTISRYHERVYDGSRLVAENVSAMRDAQTVHYYEQERLLKSETITDKKHKSITKYLYDQTKIDFSNLLELEPELEIIKVENTIDNRSRIEDTYHREDGLDSFALKWSQVTVNDEYGNPIEIRTTSQTPQQRLHIARYQYFYQE